LRKAATFTETLLVVFLTMALSSIVIESGLRVFEAFLHVKDKNDMRENSDQDPGTGDPSSLLPFKTRE